MSALSLFLLACCGLGAGFLAGLLGIGGGLVLVPVLTLLLTLNAFPSAHIVHVAVATALASIVFTSVSSIRTHHQLKGINWRLWRLLVVGILLGAAIGPVVGNFLSTRVIAFIFVLFAASSATQILLNKKPKPERELPQPVGLTLIMSLIGSVSSIIGAGGGAMTVPFLLWCNTTLPIAIGTSAALGLPIALMGSAVNVGLGWQIASLPAGMLGFIYWPALLVIALTSMFGAHFGAKGTHHYPVLWVKRSFALLLYLLCAYMLLFVIL